MKTKMTRHLTLATLGLGLAITPAAFAQSESVSAADAQVMASLDTSWIVKSAQGSLMEVAISRLAATKAASNPAVIEFANRMITDHTKSYEELRALAQKKRTVFPGEMNDDQMLVVNFFTNSTSADWAKDYMQFQVVDHRKHIDDTKKVIEDGTDPMVKAEAAKMLPILEEHLRMAEALLGTL